ncbi:PorT family protein [Dysgonomonas sp. OttesenSCG-928-D17]|nr:PorT family protein [Dysgonomonas sp. OttesenSCG-928-D17]
MKTRIKSILLSCLLITTMSVSAQYQNVYDYEDKPVVFGVRAGVAMSGQYNQDSEKSKLGIDIGFTVDFRLADKLYLLTGLDYVVKGTKTKEGHEWERVHDGNGREYKGSLVRNPAYLQLPLRVGYKLPVADKFYIMPYAGPYIAYGLGGKTKYTYTYLDNGDIETEKRDSFDGNVNRFDYGLGLGVSFEYSQFVLTAEYDWGLQRYVKKEHGYNDAKNKCLTVTLGYKF